MQFNWYPCKRRKFGQRKVKRFKQRKDHERTQIKGNHLQTKRTQETSLAGTWTVDFELPEL